MERIRAEIGGFRREWLLFPARPSAPLVIFLTGTGGTAEWADRETGWSELARREGFALAVPESLPPDLTKPPSFLTNPPRWNDGGGWKAEKDEVGLFDSSPPSAFRLSPSPDDVAFLAAVIDDTVRRLSVDTRRVFVTGFSNGAGMTFRVVAEAADRVTAIAPVAGHCWVNDPRPSRPIPTFYTVGARDLLLPLRGGEVRLPWRNRLVRRPPVTETLERWATAIGCNVVPVVQSDNKTVRIER